MQRLLILKPNLNRNRAIRIKFKENWKAIGFEEKDREEKSGLDFKIMCKRDIKGSVLRRGGVN